MNPAPVFSEGISMRIQLALLCTTWLLAPAVHAADPNTAAQKTQQLIAVVQSDAARYEKARACSKLGESAPLPPSRPGRLAERSRAQRLRALRA